MDRITAYYVRVSTDEQGQSVETQIEQLNTYKKLYRLQNTEFFIDEDWSAKDMNRPQMKRLIKLIEKKKVKTVCVTAIDRLSRNLLDTLLFLEMCEKHSTSFVCLSLNMDTSTPVGKMVVQNLSAFAEFERQTISRRVKENMLEIARKKKRYMADPPFGYTFDEHKNLVVVLEEAEWIQRMANMFIDGYGYRAISKMLNEAGRFTKKNCLWSSSSVRQILTNELYIGQLVWNRRTYNKDGKLVWRDPAEWIVHENAHPAILTEAQWKAINNKIQRRMPKGGQKQFKYRLSGLVRCAYCGGPMVSRRYGNKGPNKSKKIFVCSNYQKSGYCQFNYGFIDEIESAVYSNLEELADGVEGLISEKDMHQASDHMEEDFARRQAVINQKFQRQLQAFEAGIIDIKDLQIAKERVKKEQELLELEKARSSTPIKSEIEETIRREAKNILWLWEHGELPVLHNALRLVIECIIILGGKVPEVRLAQDLFSPE